MASSYSHEHQYGDFLFSFLFPLLSALQCLLISLRIKFRALTEACKVLQHLLFPSLKGSTPCWVSAATVSRFAPCSSIALSVVPHAQLAYFSLYLKCSFSGLLYFFLLCFMQASIKCCLLGETSLTSLPKVESPTLIL